MSARRVSCAIRTAMLPRTLTFTARWCLRSMFRKLFEVRHRHGLRYGRSPGRGWIATAILATAAQRRDLRPESAALQRLQGNSLLQLTGDAAVGGPDRGDRPLAAAERAAADGARHFKGRARSFLESRHEVPVHQTPSSIHQSHIYALELALCDVAHSMRAAPSRLQLTDRVYQAPFP